MPKKSNKKGDQAKLPQDDSEKTGEAGINRLMIDRILEAWQTGTRSGMSTVAFITLVLAAFNGGPVGRDMVYGDGYCYFLNGVTRYIAERMKVIKDGIYKTRYELNVHVPKELHQNTAMFNELIDIIKDAKGKKNVQVNEHIKVLLESYRKSEIERLENDLIKLRSFRNSDKVKDLKQKKMDEIELHISSNISIDLERVRVLAVQLDNLSKEKSKFEDKDLECFIDVMYKIIKFIEKFNEVQVLTQVDRSELERMTSELEAINPDETVHHVVLNMFYDYTINLHHRVGTAYLNQSLGQASMTSATAELGTEQEPEATSELDVTSGPLPTDSMDDANKCELCGGKTGDSGSKLKKCKCKQVRYCSPECQRADWQRHKVNCSWYQAGLDLRHQDEGGEGPAARGPVRRNAPELDE